MSKTYRGHLNASLPHGGFHMYLRRTSSPKRTNGDSQERDCFSAHGHEKRHVSNTPPRWVAVTPWWLQVRRRVFSHDLFSFWGAIYLCTFLQGFGPFRQFLVNPSWRAAQVVSVDTGLKTSRGCNSHFITVITFTGVEVDRTGRADWCLHQGVTSELCSDSASRCWDLANSPPEGKVKFSNQDQGHGANIGL